MSLLVAVIALDIAVRIVVAVLPILIPIGIGLSIIYAGWLIHRRNSSGW